MSGDLLSNIKSTVSVSDYIHVWNLGNPPILVHFNHVSGKVKNKEHVDTNKLPSSCKECD